MGILEIGKRISYVNSCESGNSGLKTRPVLECRPLISKRFAVLASRYLFCSALISATSSQRSSSLSRSINCGIHEVVGLSRSAEAKPA